MKLCLLLHCLCESYDEIPHHGKDLFVSVSDMRTLAEELLTRGYKFAPPDDPAPDTVTLTFDDGYYNNYLFREIASSYSIPYTIFVSAHYVLSGEGFPWFMNDGKSYSRLHDFDYYSDYDSLRARRGDEQPSPTHRPLSIAELRDLASTGLMEVGCHGYYHQPLSSKYRKYLPRERDLALEGLDKSLGLKPRYYAMANGLYTRSVVRELLKTFDRVFTSDGRPTKPRDRVIHRLNLVNPNIGGPLVRQIDKHLMALRQLKRTVRTTRRLWL